MYPRAPQQVFLVPWRASALVWGCVAVSSFSRNNLAILSGDRGIDWRKLIEWLLCYAGWFLLTPAMVWLVNRYPAEDRPWRNVPLLLAAGVPIAWLAPQIWWLLCGPGPWVRPPGLWLVLEFALYVSAISILHLLRRQHNLLLRERELSELARSNSELESDLRQAQLESLRARLNPHFLFNTLQCVSVMLRRNPGEASEAIAKLAELLRAVLRADVPQRSPLALEVEFIRRYLEIEQIRFGDRLSMTIEVDTEAGCALVPAFLLQPLVENALRHGLWPLRAPGRLLIRGKVERGLLRITVSDNGGGFPSTDPTGLRMGIGLSSTISRLHRIYGERHSLRLENLPACGAAVHIELPFEVAAANAA